MCQSVLTRVGLVAGIVFWIAVEPRQRRLLAPLLLARWPGWPQHG
jgi:hypothetical protein